MQSLALSFSPDSSDSERLTALETIRQWEGVTAAGLLKADAKSPAVRRMATLVLSPSADSAKLLTQLRELPVIEQASVPPTREMR